MQSEPYLSNESPLAQQLSRLQSTEEALAVLEALDKKRRENYYVKYWDPQEQQLEAIKQFTSNIKIFCVNGGNRSGKTALGAAITSVFALGKDFFKDEPAWHWVKDLPVPEPPNNIWIVGLDFPMVRDVIWGEKLRKGMDHPPFLPKDDNIVIKASDSDYQAHLWNGSTITCKSADSGREKFQAANVDLVWMDEEADGDIFDECYQRTVSTRGKLLVTFTPLRSMDAGVYRPWLHDLYEKFKSGESKNVKFASLSVMRNPYVPEDEKKLLLEKWANHPEFEARLYGGFFRRSGLVYNTWNPAKHIVRRHRTPRDWFRVGCVDPAPTGPTGALIVAVEPRTNNLYIEKEYKESNMIISEHAKNIILLQGGDPVDIWLIDPKAGAQRAAETHKTICQMYRDNGIPVRLAEVDEDYGLEAAREYINATTIINSRHPAVYVMDHLKLFQHEVERYVWDIYGKGDRKGLSKDKPVKRNDDLMNCFQYICAMRPRGKNRGIVQSYEERVKNVRLNSYT